METDSERALCVASAQPDMCLHRLRNGRWGAPPRVEGNRTEFFPTFDKKIVQNLVALGYGVITLWRVAATKTQAVEMKVTDKGHEWLFHHREL